MSGYIFFPDYLGRNEIELLQLMLKVNPSDRVSASALLMHPLFKSRRTCLHIKSKTRNQISLPSIKAKSKIVATPIIQYTFE